MRALSLTCLAASLLLPWTTALRRCDAWGFGNYFMSMRKKPEASVVPPVGSLTP